MAEAKAQTDWRVSPAACPQVSHGAECRHTPSAPSRWPTALATPWSRDAGRWELARFSRIRLTSRYSHRCRQQLLQSCRRPLQPAEQPDRHALLRCRAGRQLQATLRQRAHALPLSVQERTICHFGSRHQGRPVVTGRATEQSVPKGASTDPGGRLRLDVVAAIWQPCSRLHWIKLRAEFLWAGAGCRKGHWYGLHP